MIVGNVAKTQANASGVPLPEGISRHSPFATNNKHPLASESIYMLEHPCFAMRSLEEIAKMSFDINVKNIKNRYGLDKVGHFIKTNDNGVVKNTELPEGFVSTYWGIFSVICGTTLPQVFKMLKPNDVYPIGYTKLITPVTVFKGYVPTFNNINSFVDVAHYLHYSVGQEIKKRFIYSLIPYVDQTQSVTPILYLNNESKLEQMLQSIIQKKGFTEVEIHWDDLVSKFSDNIEASLAKDSNYFLDVPNPVTKLYSSVTTQPDNVSLGQAISMVSSQSYKPVQLDIVPENKLQIFNKPKETSEIRQQKLAMMKKEQAIRDAISDDAKHLQDISQLF